VTVRRVRGVLPLKHHCEVQKTKMAPRISGRPFPQKARGNKCSGIAQVEEYPPSKNNNQICYRIS
jgi:hypothetical protein